MVERTQRSTWHSIRLIWAGSVRCVSTCRCLFFSFSSFFLFFFPALADFLTSLFLSRVQETGKTLTLQVDAEGSIKYDALATQGLGKDRVVHSKFTDLVPKDIKENDKVYFSSLLLFCWDYSDQTLGGCILTLLFFFLVVFVLFFVLFLFSFSFSFSFHSQLTSEEF